MTHAYDNTGRWVSVTRLAVGPCTVTQVKKIAEADGYNAVQLVFGKTRHLNQPLAGHLKPASLTQAPRFIQEIRQDDESVSVGDQVKVSDVFQEGDVVKVTGWTKGRGFAGVVKRWGFSGGPKTHGQSDRHRAPGSIGQGTDPGRVHKGKKMPGKYGPDRKSIKNLRVFKVDSEKNELWVRGAVPGHTNNKVVVSILKASPREAKNEEVNETNSP